MTEYSRPRQAKYQHSPKGKATEERYENSPKGRARYMRKDHARRLARMARIRAQIQALEATI